MAATPSPGDGLEEYSASATTVPFERPLPLLRGPLRAAPGGPFVLAFRDAAAWRSALRACESRIAEQCEAAARLGCAMTASSKCRPPWWRKLVGHGAASFEERLRCEEREMEGCLAAAREKCAGFARERCLKSFREARVSARAARGWVLDRKRARKLVSLAMVMDKPAWIGLFGLDRELGATNFRASELIGRDFDVDCVLGGSS